MTSTVFTSRKIMVVNEITSLKCDCGCGKTFTGNAGKSNMKKHKERMKLVLSEVKTS